MKKWYNSHSSCFSIRASIFETKLQYRHSMYFYSLSFSLRWLIPAFRLAQEHPNVSRNGYRMQSVHSTPSIHQASKLQNWIVKPILNGSSCSEFVLKAINQGFQMSPRMSKCGQKSVRIHSVHCTLSYASRVKTLKLNCKTNTQPIFMG